MAKKHTPDRRYKYTVATAQYVLDTVGKYVDEGKAHDALAALASKGAELTYISHIAQNGKERIYPVYFTNIEVQAPWITLGNEDLTLSKVPGQLKRGTAFIDVSPNEMFLEKTYINDAYLGTTLNLVLGGAVVEDYSVLVKSKKADIAEYSNRAIISGNAVLGSDSTVGNDCSVTGSVSLKSSRIHRSAVSGRATISGGSHITNSNISGSVSLKSSRIHRSAVSGRATISGGSHITNSNISGSVSLHGAEIDRCSIRGNFSLIYNEELPEDHSGQYISGCEYDYAKIFSKKSLESSRTKSNPFVASKVKALMEAASIALESDQALIMFCLDAKNHAPQCKCGIYYPLLLLNYESAMLYWSKIDPRFADANINLPITNPLAHYTKRQLEPLMVSQLRAATESEAWQKLDKTPSANAANWVQHLNSFTGINLTAQT